MDPFWATGAGPRMSDAVQGGPLHYGPTAPGVAALLLAAAGLILLMKISGFRAMVAVGRN